MSIHEVTALADSFPQISVDEAVEEAAAAVRMLSDARAKCADTSATMASMFEQLKDSYTSLGRDFEELQAAHALAIGERDAANAEREAAVADVRKLIRAFQLFVNAASNAGEALMSQDDRVKARMELYKSIGRYGAPDVPAPPVAPTQSAQPAPRPAVSVRPLVQPATVEAPSSVQASGIEEEITVALDAARAQRNDVSASVVEFHEHRRPPAKVETPVPAFLTRGRAPVDLDEGERKARSSVASGFGLFAGKRKG